MSEIKLTRVPTALIFPGQAAQHIGMGGLFFDEFILVRDLFSQASKAIGVDLAKLCFEGPQEKLTLTENAQPAILTLSVISYRLLAREINIDELVVGAAGHSLGELSALAAFGALRFTDAVRMARARGEAMQKAVPAGQGAMAAVMNLKAEKIKEICLRVAENQVVELVNFNAPSQIVIAGHIGAVKRACSSVTSAGGKAIILDVSAPFHCSLMKPAADSLARVLSNFKLHEPQKTVLRNVDNLPHQDPDSIRDFLVRQVTSPIKWAEAVSGLQQLGAQQFVVLSPSRVMAGLMRRIDQTMPVAGIEDPESLQTVAEQLSN